MDSFCTFDIYAAEFWDFEANTNYVVCLHYILYSVKKINEIYILT